MNEPTDLQIALRHYYQAKTSYMCLPIGASGSNEETGKDRALAKLLEAISRVYTVPANSYDEIEQKLELFIETELETLERAQAECIMAICADLKRLGGKRLANESSLTIIA